MRIFQDRQAVLIMVLLLIGVMSSASIVPYMGVYIVEGLQQEPWLISVYSVITITLTLIVNRQFGEMIDNGTRVSSLILVSIIAFAIGNIAIILVQEFWILITVVSLCFSISNAATSAMYSYGRIYADQQKLDIARYNSYLRTMTSLGWMFAPALSFLLADSFGSLAVFYFALGLVVFWFLLWHVAIPKEFANLKSDIVSETEIQNDQGPNRKLWLAAFVCLCFALAHSLAMSALPLFYLQDVGLPGYAPGLSFSVKTFVEIIAILTTPLLMQRFDAQKLLCFSAGMALLAFYILSNVTSVPQMVFGAALEGLYYGIFAGVGITYIQSFSPDKVARATSLYMNSLFLGGLISGSSMGLIAQAYDFRTAIQLASIWAIVAILVLIFTNPNRQPKAN